MIPVSLTIKGLYSYQEVQKIQFDRLIDGQLFGIFGAVGSGKSSILEAISFALYGETERLNQRDSRNYNMMNLKSDELLIDFEFKNYDDISYRFTVRGKRNSKDFLKVNTFDRAAYKWVGSEWEPLESASAETILGLSYKNFRRTIIIPQGKFQEFLQLGDSDRTKMLKEIFYLDKFEFYYQTSNLEKKNNDALQNLTGQLSHYVLVNQEIITQKESEVKKISEECNLHKIQILKKDMLYKEQQDLKRLYDEKADFQLELDILVAKEESIHRLEKRVKDYEYCNLHFRDLLYRKKEAEQSIKTRERELESHLRVYDANSEELIRLDKEGNKIKSEFIKQDHYRDLVSDYEMLLSTVELELEIRHLLKRITDGQLHVNKTAEERSAAHAKLEELRKQKGKLRSQLPDIDKLASLRNWFDRREQFKQAADKQKDSLQKLGKQQLVITDILQTLLVESNLEGIELGSFPDYFEPRIDELRKRLSIDLEAMQKRINHLHLQRKLGEFSSKLVDGEACGLCGSIHHPMILKIEDVETHLSRLNYELEELKQRDRALEVVLNELFKLIFQERSVRDQIKEAESELTRLAELVTTHNSSFAWNDFSPHDDTQVTQAFSNARKLQLDLEVIESEIQTQETIISAKANDFERFSAVVNKLNLQLAGKESELSTLKKRIRTQHLVDVQAVSKEELMLKILSLKDKLEADKDSYDKWLEKSSYLNDQKIALKERVEFTKQAIAECREQFRKVKVELKEEFIGSPFVSFDEVIDILENAFSGRDKLEDAKKIVSEYYQKVYSLKVQIDKLSNMIGEKTFNNESFLDLETSLKQLKENYEIINTSYIHEQSVLGKMKKDLETKILLESELEKLQHRAANLYTLKQLFKSDGFVSYISTVYLQNLCEAANKRFYKLTRQQLRLEVTNKNEFQVRDFLNNGRVRSVKTLSGGQTFQASLSLALALAESVQQQNQSNQNFFFLDEGFGSLDRESLQVAFDTLKSLRQENRIVGIISHVDELQQEIDVFLSVVNDPFTGSKVTANWH